ncbi:hypothetical protein ENBRE01_1707 [Enteropsectra breve]|nr:hypothetical protein ENBRE01_1707 [Enteropsectra breve]
MSRASDFSDNGAASQNHAALQRPAQESQSPGLPCFPTRRPKKMPKPSQDTETVDRVKPRRNPLYAHGLIRGAEEHYSELSPVDECYEYDMDSYVCPLQESNFPKAAKKVKSDEQLMQELEAERINANQELSRKLIEHEKKMALFHLKYDLFDPQKAMDERFDLGKIKKFNIEEKARKEHEKKSTVLYSNAESEYADEDDFRVACHRSVQNKTHESKKSYWLQSKNSLKQSPCQESSDIKISTKLERINESTDKEYRAKTYARAKRKSGNPCSEQAVSYYDAELVKYNFKNRLEEGMASRNFEQIKEEAKKLYLGEAYLMKAGNSCTEHELRLLHKIKKTSPVPTFYSEFGNFDASASFLDAGKKTFRFKKVSAEEEFVLALMAVFTDFIDPAENDCFDNYEDSSDNFSPYSGSTYYRSVEELRSGKMIRCPKREEIGKYNIKNFELYSNNAPPLEVTMVPNIRFFKCLHPFIPMLICFCDEVALYYYNTTCKFLLGKFFIVITADNMINQENMKRIIQKGQRKTKCDKYNYLLENNFDLSMYNNTEKLVYNGTNLFLNVVNDKTSAFNNLKGKDIHPFYRPGDSVILFFHFGYFLLFNMEFKTAKRAEEAYNIFFR